MEQFHGVGVTPGRVVGRVRQMPAPVAEPPAGARPGGTAVELEAERIRAASTSVQTALKERAAMASGDARGVLEATALMAADPMLVKGAVKLLAPSQDGVARTAERAVWESGAAVAEKLKSLGGYMAERAADVLDVRSRIVAELRGLPAPGIPESDEPFVLAAEDLAPADTATLDPAKVIALITSGGGPQSHTAILARALGLPAVVAAAGVDRLADGTAVFVDGGAGTVATDPGRAESDAAAAWTEQAAALAQFTGTNVLADGHVLPLLANVATGRDAAAAAAAGAEGVGLLRTEFAFLDRDTEPTHEEQVAAYGAVFEHFAGKKVVIRTLDAGADKPLPFLTNTDEPNPALGVRGYRTDWTSPGVLARQLAAIAAAAAAHEADVWVMAPMIATAEEADHFVDLAAQAGLATAGVMVEVPSAALSSAHLLRRAAFASLGTNDLTQYAMAADRMLGPLAHLNNPWQPAVLALIKATCDGAAAAEAATGTPKPVGVCGESAADPALAVVLAGLGVTSLSMTSRSLAAVNAVLKTVTLDQAKALAAQALAEPTAEEARDRVRAALPALGTLGL
ncbi:phosphoenolpyruvate-protein phosphotransferase [Sinomonas cyclohexanicum]|uniref:Phosphoenolpyruvate-protein phosphotransferase n=1 Tax=Sinomonas cyclohexanicum TaxID=322009 RepID=A0ABN6FMM1_SINCY|nr:phosphoenolpyruvate--protein phosphotransferase [Corynebacterium cyclohexanicum]BCT77356.1 phosphoenolpyruvate-protein phosphotransferase [Corynebacterium cyclohexanicum]